MKQILAVAVLVVAATALALGQTGGNEGKTKDKATVTVEQALMQMERDWTEANLKKDVATLDKIIADDYVVNGPAGVSTKVQLLADIKSGDYKFDSMTMGDMKVRVFGETAIVTGSDDEKSSYKGKDTSGHYTWTDVFVKRQGRWQAVATQATLIAKQ